MALITLQELTRIPAKWREMVPQCSNSGCRRSGLKHMVSKRYVGAAIGTEWFCSLDCFEQGLKTKLSEMISPNFQAERGRSLRTPMGLLLLSRGVLSPEQLQIALETQRASGAPIGNIVQELGFVTPAQVTAAVAAQWACPVFSLRGHAMPTAIRIPRKLLQSYEFLPVHFAEKGRKLLVGFVKGIRYHALRTIEEITSCTTTPCFITEAEYHWELNSAETPAEREIIFDKRNEVGEIARVLRNYVHQVGAETTRFGLFGDYLWARIWGRANELDLLFRVRGTA